MFGHTSTYKVKIVSNQYRKFLENYGLILEEKPSINSYKVVMDAIGAEDLKVQIWVVSIKEDV